MTQVTAPQTLQERVGARIKEQIGDLLTEDDLKRLVETALHDAFFTRKKINDQWDREIRFEEPHIVEVVRTLLKERVDVAVTAWLDAHKDEFKQHLDDAIGNGLLVFMKTWLDGKVQTDLFNFGQALQTRLGIC